jgi:hypothetical protein
MAGELVRYDAMCQAIAAAYQVDEVKDIRDRAAALEYYARQSQNVEAERQCCEIRLRAERKAGQLLRQMEKLKGRPHKASNVTMLSDLGITRDQSSQWQRLADVSDEQFELALARSDKPTTNGIINRTAAPVITPVSREALWLWGRLRDFTHMGVLASTPSEVMATMTPEMIDDVRAEAPRVIAWLGGIGEEQ